MASCVVLVFNAAVGADGVPVNVGLILNTLLPVPVLVVTPVPPFATANVPPRVIAPELAEFGVSPVDPALKELTTVEPPIALVTKAVVAICGFQAEAEELKR